MRWHRMLRRHVPGAWAAGCLLSLLAHLLLLRLLATHPGPARPASAAPSEPVTLRLQTRPAAAMAPHEPSLATVAPHHAPDPLAQPAPRSTAATLTALAAPRSTAATLTALAAPRSTAATATGLAAPRYYTPDELDQVPRFLRYRRPLPAWDAADVGPSAVTVQLLVDSTGTVQRVLLDGPVLQTATRQWIIATFEALQFSPGMRDGVAVPTQMKTTFSVEDAPAAMAYTR